MHVQEHEPEPPTTGSGGIGIDVASLIEGMDPNSLEQWETAFVHPDSSFSTAHPGNSQANPNSSSVFVEEPERIG